MAQQKRSSSPGDKTVTGKEAIFQAVVHVVAEKGLRGLTFRAVAEHANVSFTLPAHYFKTRDVMIEETLRWASGQALESTHLATFASSKDEYRDALLHSLVHDPDLHIFQIEMIVEARRRPELQPQIQHLYGVYLQAMRNDVDALGTVQASDPLLRSVFASIDGLILQYIGGTMSVTELRDSLLALWDLVLGQRETAPSKPRTK